MKVLVKIPMNHFDGLLKKCDLARPEYLILKNGMITRNNDELGIAEIFLPTCECEETFRTGSGNLPGRGSLHRVISFARAVESRIGPHALAELRLSQHASVNENLHIRAAHTIDLRPRTIFTSGT
jgi:hypothetical protein